MAHTDSARPDDVGVLHTRGTRFMVFDDVLTSAEFDELASAFARLELVPRSNNSQSEIDGPSYRGRTSQRSLADSGLDLSPWEAALAARVKQNLGLFGGKRREQEIVLASTPWRYPVGSQLHWHQDRGAEKIGAFIFYTHRTWGTHWGGGLTILDTESQASAVTETEIMESVLDPVVILPKPNRLVLLRANTLHHIQRVDRCAGVSARCAIAGFIIEPAELTALANDSVAYYTGNLLFEEIACYADSHRLPSCRLLHGLAPTPGHRG